MERKHRPWYGIIQFEEQIIMTAWENQKGLHLHYISRLTSGCRWSTINDFWSISGNFTYRHYVEPRVKLYRPREESFPVPRKYIDVTRATHTNLRCDARRATSMIIGISIDQEICLILDRFHTIHLTEGKASRRNFVVRGKIDETASNIKAWSFGAWNLEKYVRELENKGQAKLGKWKTEDRKCPKLDRNLIHWPWGYGIQGDHQECSEKVGNASRTCYAV